MDNQGNILGVCSVCGYIYDVVRHFEMGCPACRAARVEEAFRPVDPLRTALAVTQEQRKEQFKEEFRKQLLEGISPNLSAVVYRRGKSFQQDIEDLDRELEDKPKGLRMPKDEAGQIYELRRLFRL